MTCVINDSGPEAAENKPAAAKRQEQKRRKRKGKAWKREVKDIRL